MCPFLTKNLRLSNKQQEKKNTPEMNRLENDVVNAILLSYFHFGDRVVLFSCISKYWQQFIIKSLAYESLRPYALASWMAVLPNIMMCKTLMAYLNDDEQDNRMLIEGMLLFAVRYQHMDKLEWVISTFEFTFSRATMAYMLLDYLVQHAYNKKIESRALLLRNEFYIKYIRNGKGMIRDFILVQVCAQGDIETFTSLLASDDAKKEIGRAKSNASLRAAVMSNNLEMVELACKSKTRLSPNLNLFDKVLSMCNPEASSEVLHYVLHRNKSPFQGFCAGRAAIEKTFERAFIAGQVAFCIYLNDEFHLPLKKILFENEVAKRAATNSIAWMLTLNLFPHLFQHLSSIMEHALYKQRWDVIDLLFAHFPFQTVDLWKAMKTQISIDQIVLTISDYEWWNPEVPHHFHHPSCPIRNKTCSCCQSSCCCNNQCSLERGCIRFSKSFSPTIGHVLDILSRSPSATEQQVEKLFLVNASHDSWSCISAVLMNQGLINYPILHLTWLYLSRSEISFQRLQENIDEMEFIKLVARIGHIRMMNEILHRAPFQEALQKIMNESCLGGPWWFTQNYEMIQCLTSHYHNTENLVIESNAFTPFYYWLVIKVEGQTDVYASGGITNLGNENVWKLVCTEESCRTWVTKLKTSRKSKLLEV